MLLLNLVAAQVMLERDGLLDLCTRGVLHVVVSVGETTTCSHTEYETEETEGGARIHLGSEVHTYTPMYLSDTLQILQAYVHRHTHHAAPPNMTTT